VSYGLNDDRAFEQSVSAVKGARWMLAKLVEAPRELLYAAIAREGVGAKGGEPAPFANMQLSMEKGVDLEPDTASSSPVEA